MNLLRDGLWQSATTGARATRHHSVYLVPIATKPVHVYSSRYCVGCDNYQDQFLSTVYRVCMMY